MIDSRVSIIVPSFNSERFISECIDSVLCQTYLNWELLIVDGGSSDGTVAIVDRYSKTDDRIKLILNHEDDGPAQARAYGIARAKGEFFAFLDSDDLWVAEKLELQLEFMLTRKIEFSFTSYRYLYEDGRPSYSTVTGWSQNTYSQYLGRRGIANSTVLLSRKCMTKTVLDTVGKSHGEDTLWWLLIMRAGTNAYCYHNPLTFYRKVPGSLSSRVLKNQATVWHSYRNELGLSVLETGYHYLRYLFDVMGRRSIFFIKEKLRLV